MPYRRTGNCKRSAQCCGVRGDGSPWDRRWPGSVANWQIDVLVGTHPVFQLTGHPLLNPERVAFQVRIQNKTCSGLWVPGKGLCTNKPPLNDHSSYEESCPFLGKQEPDGSYPCLLAGTQWDAVYQQCMNMGPEVWDDRSAEQWMADHPDCGYEWEHIPE